MFRKRFKISLLFSLLAFIIILLSQSVFAGSLSPAFVVFDREKINTPTGGTVCATPETVATEGRVIVTFPTNFTVNTTASNWTVSTTDLPSDSGVAWPGIGTATSVSGKSVTFPSGDLVVGTEYCFNFSGTNTLTMPTVVDNNISGTIATQTSGAAAIDSVTWYPYMNENDQVSITGVVPNNVEAYSTVISCLSQGNIFSQNTTINYQITYGTTSSSSQDITLVASWSDGTISGGGGNVEIVDYVVGSASNAYGGASPIIDPVAQTITWTISSFPGNLQNQTVTFSLQTNSNYTGSSQVSFTTSSWIEIGSDETVPSTVTKYYLYNTPSSSPTPSSPTPASSTTPASSSSTTTPFNLIFTQIRILELTASKAKIQAILNGNANVTMYYGKNPKSLNQKLVSLSVTNIHQIEIPNLDPNTYYFFRLAANGSGDSATSDIYTFKTARVGQIPEVDVKRLTFISGTIFDFLTTIGDEIIGIVLPTETAYEFRVPILNYQNIKSVKAYVFNSKVLGVNSENGQINTFESSMIEIYPGVYSGKLKTGSVTGIYEMYLLVEDTNGNILQQPLFNIRNVLPLRLVDQKSGKGLEGILVKLYFYNSRTKIYEELASNAIGIDNPVVSIIDGRVPVVLPAGKYRAETLGVGYKDQTLDFEINYYSDKNYPNVVLEREQFNLITFFKYYWQIFSEVFRGIISFVSNLTISQRFFDLLSFLSISALIILLLTVSSLKIGTPIWHPKSFFEHTKLLLTGKKSNTMIVGVVQESETKKGIMGATINLVSVGSNQILTHTLSQVSGKFMLRATDLNGLKLIVIKDGYQIGVTSDLDQESLVIGLNREEGVIDKSKVLFEQMITFLIGFLLLVGLILEISFISHFGVLQTLPFIIITLLNLGLWGVYAFKKGEI